MVFATLLKHIIYIEYAFANKGIWIDKVIYYQEKRNPT